MCAPPPPPDFFVPFARDSQTVYLCTALANSSADENYSSFRNIPSGLINMQEYLYVHPRRDYALWDSRNFQTLRSINISTTAKSISFVAAVRCECVRRHEGILCYGAALFCLDLHYGVWIRCPLGSPWVWAMF